VTASIAVHVGEKHEIDHGGDSEECTGDDRIFGCSDNDIFHNYLKIEN
jgi:hypothetical protein